jgi:hypothetical protein
MGCLEVLPQPSERTMSRRLHSSLWNLEKDGRFADRQIQDKSHDGDLPLLIGKLSKGSGQHLAIFDLTDIVRNGCLALRSRP